MNDRELKVFLKQSLQQEVRPERLDECIKLCIDIMCEQRYAAEETRTGFFGYLSDVFRFEGIPIFGLQALTLFLVCLMLSLLASDPKYIPAFMPLFALTVIPAVFKSQYYNMSEMEAVTRASGAQIMLAKLILAGTANLVCITVLLGLEVYLQESYDALGQMVLYCVVPYLVCMVALLRLIRVRKKEGMPIYAISVFTSCICWGMSAKLLPWLYETAAIGLWIIVVLVFAVFFIKEVYFIVKMRKEGKMYGIIA
ncbi:MAG: hypothetical protein J1E83_13850 [Lachnospiraceae bacterium]|nr:hypothetical protein [Lachnospiraceae bacterium]